MTLDPNSPFTRAEAQEHGMTPWEMRNQRRLHRNVLIGRHVLITPLVRARAALKVAPPGSVITGRIAAGLLGGVVPVATVVDLIIPPHERLRVAGIRARRGVPSRRAFVHGIPVTPAEETFAFLGQDLRLVEHVVLGDSLLAAGRTTPQALMALCARSTGASAQAVRRAASLVRARVESPMETRLRLLLVLAGLPEPEVNHPIDGTDGRRWRLDLAYPAYRLAIEYDGRRHAESSAQWERDVERREGLDALGWRVIVVLGKDVFRTPAATLERVVTAMDAVGMPRPPLRDEWREWFVS